MVLLSLCQREGFLQYAKIQITPALRCPNLGPANGFFWQGNPPSFLRNPCCTMVSTGLHCKGPYIPATSQLQSYPLLSQKTSTPMSSSPGSLTQPDKILLSHTQNFSSRPAPQLSYSQRSLFACKTLHPYTHTRSSLSSYPSQGGS